MGIKIVYQKDREKPTIHIDNLYCSCKIILSHNNRTFYRESDAAVIRQLEEYTPEAVEQIQSDLSILTGQKINQDIIDEIRTIIETLRSGSADFEAISDEWEHPRTIFHLLLIDSERTDLWKELQSSPELLRSVLTVGRAYSLEHRH